MNKEEMIKELKEILADAESSEEYVEGATCYGSMKDRIETLIKNGEKNDTN